MPALSVPAAGAARIHLGLPRGRFGEAAGAFLMEEAQRYDVLLVACDPEAVALATNAFRQRQKGRVYVAATGEEALRFLRRETEHLDAPVPDLVLMDAELPDRPGHDVLSELRSDPALGPVPVVLMTDARADSDILMTCGTGGRCYVSRPVDPERFLRTLDVIEQFWFRVVRVAPCCLQ